MNVDIERIHELKAELNKINSVDIREITFMENGKSIQIDDELLNEWRFIGLSNTDFITTDFYLGTEI